MPGLCLRISGEPPVAEFAARPKPTLWRESWVRAAFAILSQGMASGHWELPIKVKRLAETAGISVGAASAARKGLAAKGFLEQTGRSTFLVLDRVALLNAWVAEYADLLYNKLTLGELHVASLELDGIWGGETAASELTGLLVPEVHTIYIDEAFSR